MEKKRKEKKSENHFFILFRYGDEFLHETYLYHVTRQDHRHNFSLWFYQMYLGLEYRWIGLLAFIPQLLLVTVTGIVFAKDIFFACFIQTFLFVTFNKVCTSQVNILNSCIFTSIIIFILLLLFFFILVFYVVYMFISISVTINRYFI